MSTRHLPIGCSLVFDLARPPHPLLDHGFLRRSFVLQLPPPLLVLQPTPQPSIQDDHLNVLPFPQLLSLHRPPRRPRGHLRYGFYDRRIRTFGFPFLARSSPRRRGLGFLKGGQIACRYRCENAHGSDLVDGPDHRLCSCDRFRVHSGMLGCRRTLLYLREEASDWSVYSEEEI